MALVGAHMTKAIHKRDIMIGRPIVVSWDPLQVHPNLANVSVGACLGIWTNLFVSKESAARIG